MKKLISSLLIFCMILCLCACGESSTAAPAAAGKPAEEPAAEVQAADLSGMEKPGAEEPEAAVLPEGFAPDFSFSTTDRDGNEYDESVFAGAKLTLINFWEPWCPPCVAEMPDLQALYEKYSAEGVNFLGVYSTEDMEEKVVQVLENAGTAYPVLHYCDAFGIFETGYVPDTVFIDGNGHIILHETDTDLLEELEAAAEAYRPEDPERLAQTVYVGSYPLEVWDEIISETLAGLGA